ncbi:hypothetical protein WBP06_20660 [Novosphingobium sp. BL-8H]|uniref:hypothetical protein n=1 Tax=Novosphingobium sp. BL-8H TaxID=3127640 RepID=UPI003757D45C
MSATAWIVRVKHNKVSVGIFACAAGELVALVEEVCDPGVCEFKPLPSGGFVFGGAVVLHEVEKETSDRTSEGEPTHFSDGYLTEGWAEAAYEDEGQWWPILIAEND